MLNIGSLISGIGAWLFGFFAITCVKMPNVQKNSTVSFSLCIFSVILQLFEINRRVVLGDYAAIEDTIKAVLLASVLLVSVTIILNLIALINSKRRLN